MKITVKENTIEATDRFAWVTFLFVFLVGTVFFMGGCRIFYELLEGSHELNFENFALASIFCFVGLPLLAFSGFIITASSKHEVIKDKKVLIYRKIRIFPQSHIKLKFNSIDKIVVSMGWEYGSIILELKDGKRVRLASDVTISKLKEYKSALDSVVPEIVSVIQMVEEKENLETS